MGTILVAGATGLIGKEVLSRALADDRFERVIAVGRKEMPVHPKLEQWVHADLLAALRSEHVDAVVCCLGTTIRNVDGDKARFIHVDKDLVLGIARWAKEHAVKDFAVVSAIGADAESRVFYNRVKGEMEAGLKAIGLSGLHIFHPSILTGPRVEKRLGERIGIVVMSAIAPLLPARYKPMPYDVLAQALLNSIGEPSTTFTYSEIRALAAIRS